MSFTESSFAVMVHAKESADTPPAVERKLVDEFSAAAGGGPDKTIEAETFIIHFCHSSSAVYAEDKREKIHLILHGEIYGGTTDPAGYILELYREKGPAFAGDLNGSFVLFVADVSKKRVFLVTDRINSKKVFYRKYPGRYWFSTSISFLPMENAEIDTAGLAGYLANGVVYNYRTLFEGVRILKQAGIHSLNGRGFHYTPYWKYEFNHEYARRDEGKLKAELGELLVEAVRVRTEDNPGVFLSLSGGHDSTAILGIMKYRLGLQNVECFSYSRGEAVEGTDEYAAREMAKIAGYPHRLVSSYAGDLMEVLRKNADRFQGIAHICEEIDAWPLMAREFQRSTDSVLFAGENCLGQAGDTYLYRFQGLYWLKRFIGADVYASLSESWNEEHLRIIDKFPESANAIDKKHWFHILYLLPAHFLSWREFFIGPFVRVRNPLLDNRLLDFSMKLSVPHRRFRSLQKKTVREMFPELFSVDRAHHSSYPPDWKTEIRIHRSEVEWDIMNSESRLDDFVPPEALRRLLIFSGSGPTADIRLVSLARRLFRGIIRRTYAGERILARYPIFLYKIIDPATLIRRLLVLRLFMKK